MKKNFFKRGMAGLLSLVMCLTALAGIGTTTAYAAGERAEVYLVSFPRSGDANIDYSGTWGHPNLRYMNGWHSGESKYTTIRAMHSYDGIPALDPMDKNYQRVKYVRYADDFVVCIIGSKATANEIKERIAGFMQKELHLELSREKTKITNLSDKRVRFLGYEITKSQENTKQVVDSIGRKKRSVNGTIQLVVPGDVIREKLKPFIKKGKPYQVGARVNLPVIEIISQYNAEIRGLYNYYCLATDVSTKISTFQYYHYFSMIKTIARKEKSSVKKVIQKYGIDVPRKNGTGTMRIVGIRYNTKEGPKTMTYFNDSLKKVSRPAGEISDQFGQVLKGGQLMKRLNSDVCELCGAEHCALEIHHVRKLKDIVKKYRKRGTPMPNWVWLMSYMKRKTLVLCHDCHVNLHNGTL